MLTTAMADDLIGHRGRVAEQRRSHVDVEPARGIGAG
jgi:hypothetical protein